jgi:hypothetical protein
VNTDASNISMDGAASNTHSAAQRTGLRAVNALVTTSNTGITAKTTIKLQGPKLEKAIQIPHPTAGVPPVKVPDPQVAPRLHPMPSESVLRIHNVSSTLHSRLLLLVLTVYYTATLRGTVYVISLVTPLM